MLEKIEYIFPENEENIELFNLLIRLFKNISYVQIINNNEIQIISSKLKPKTVFKLDKNSNDILIDIGENQYLNLLIGNREYNNELCGIKRIKPQEIAKRLENHIKRIDHTGINLPTSTFSKEQWGELLKYLATISNIYNYPTGKPWPFLLPTTEEENSNEITNFNIVREPRFELVYDEYTNRPTLQIDIETNLSKEEVERLFPQEDGIYFDTLENVYKAIYLDYNGYIAIRFDVRFETQYSDFESGKWIVENGKRILP